MFVTAEVFHPLMSMLKADASWNMYSMSVTAEVFHPLMSALKADASWNMACTLVTADTSHVSISPQLTPPQMSGFFA